MCSGAGIENIAHDKCYHEFIDAYQAFCTH